MKLESRIAVWIKIIATGVEQENLVTAEQYQNLLKFAGKTVVILEAWQMGKCISN